MLHKQTNSTISLARAKRISCYNDEEEEIQSRNLKIQNSSHRWNKRRKKAISKNRNDCSTWKTCDIKIRVDQVPIKVSVFILNFGYCIMWNY